MNRKGNTLYWDYLNICIFNDSSKTATAQLHIICHGGGKEGNHAKERHLTVNDNLSLT